MPGGRLLGKGALVSGLTALLCLVFTVIPAPALTGDSEGALGIDGSLRTIGILFRNYQFPALYDDERADQSFQALLRITAAGRPGDACSYEIHLVNALTYSSRDPGGGRPGGVDRAGEKRRYRALDEVSEWWNGDRAGTVSWLDRCNIKVALNAVDLTLGRQAVTFGKAHFWNPLDLYLPFDPDQFDRDYKPGVDALRADIPLGNFSGVTLVGVLGRETDDSGRGAHDDRLFDSDWYYVARRCWGGCSRTPGGGIWPCRRERSTEASTWEGGLSGRSRAWRCGPRPHISWPMTAPPSDPRSRARSSRTIPRRCSAWADASKTA